jgi:hypothetical protein
MAADAEDGMPFGGARAFRKTEQLAVELPRRRLVADAEGDVTDPRETGARRSCRLRSQRNRDSSDGGRNGKRA